MYSSFYNNLIKFISIAIILIFTNLTYSEEVDYASNCGMTSKEVVDPLSWSVCEEDVSFLMFYKLFPDVYDELIFPFLNPRYLSNVKNIESDNRHIYEGYQSSIIKIFSSLSNLSLVLGGFFLLWYSFLGLLKTANDGEFLGESWSTPKTLIKYGIIGFLLIPVGKGLIVIHLIILALILFSIAFANFIWGAYLSYVEIGEDATDLNLSEDLSFKESETDKTDFLNGKFNQYDHNFFYASEHVKSLLKLNLCKVRTEQYYQENLALTLNGSSLDNALECNNTNHLKMGDIDTNENNNVFVWKKEVESNIKTTTNTNSENAYFPQKFVFGKYKEKVQDCSLEENVYNYYCGSVDVNVPIIRNEKIEMLLREIGFYNLLQSSFNSVNNAALEEIEDVSYQNWLTIYNRLVEKLTDDKRNFSAHNEYVVKTVSYIYHQLLMNELLIGSKNNSSLNKDLEAINDTTKLLIAAHCVDNYEELKRSKNYNKYINSGRGEISTVCLLPNTGDLIASSLSQVENPNESNSLSANQELKDNYFSVGRISMAEIIEDIMLKRKGVELSLFKSLRSISNGSLVEDLRKKGWATIGGYALKISKELELNNKIMNNFRSSIIFNTAEISGNMINAEVLSYLSNSDAPEETDNFKDLSSYYSKMIGAFASGRSDLRSDVNVANYTESFITENIDETNKQEDFTESVLGFLSNPLATFKFAIGMSEATDLSKDTLQMCFEDMSKCPVPLENPLVKLNSFGHELVNVGTSIITASLIVSFIGHINNTISLSKFVERKGGSATKGLDKSAKMIQKIGSGLKMGVAGIGASTAKALLTTVNVIDIILSILLPIASVLISVGIFFAYILPLIPYIAFTMSFLAWIVLCIELLVIAPMWLVFSLRLVEKGNTNSEHYKAAFNFGLQVLFRPSLIAIGFLLAWSLFSVFFMIVSFTIVPFLMPLLSGEYGVLSPFGIVDALLAILTYGVIIYIILKFLFNIMERLPNNIFSYMGVASINDAQSTAKSVLENSIMATVMQTGTLRNMAEQSKRSLTSKKIKKEMKEREEARALKAKADEIARKKERGDENV